MNYCDDILVCTSGEVHGTNTDSIIEKINQYKPKYFILWQVGEFHAPQFMSLVEHNFNTSKDFTTLKKFEDCLVTNNTIFYLILGGDERSNTYKNFIDYKIKNFNIIFWTTFLLHYSYYGLKSKYGDIFENEVNTEFERLYVNYNNKARRHRCMLMDELSKNNLLNYGFNSWHGHHKSYEFKYWKEEILKIDEFQYEKHDTTYSKNLINKKVLFNLITESDDFHENLFFTEKTFRTILIGQPFLCLGAKNQNIGLEKFGFKLYDEIFDYSFDSETDLDKRVGGIIYNILKLKDLNYNKLFESIKEKVVYNRNKAKEIVKNDPYFPKNLLDLYTTYGDCFLSKFKLWNDDYKRNYPFVNDLDLFDEILKTKI